MIGSVNFLQTFMKRQSSEKSNTDPLIDHINTNNIHSDTHFGAGTSLVLVWKSYLWESASMEDIAVSWRIFTTLATHAAVQAIKSDGDCRLHSVVSGNCDGNLSRLRRLICARLENASWRVWFDKYQNSLMHNSLNAAGSNRSILSDANRQSEQELVAFSGFSTLGESSKSVSSKRASQRFESSTNVKRLTRCRSEPNILMLPCVQKEQQLKVASWLADYMINALQSPNALLPASSLPDALMKKTEAKVEQSHQHHSSSSSANNLSGQQKPELQGNCKADYNRIFKPNPLIVDIPQMGMFHKYRYVIPIPQRSLLTKIIKESTEELASNSSKQLTPSTSIDGKPLQSDCSSNNTLIHGGVDRNSSMTSLRHSSSSSLSNNIACNCNNANTTSNQRKSSCILQIPTRSSNSAISSKGRSEVNSFNSTLLRRSNETAHIEPQNETVTVFTGSVHKITPPLNNASNGSLAAAAAPPKKPIQPHPPSIDFFEQPPSIW